MPQPSVPFLPNDKQQGAIVDFARNCVESLQSTWNLREQFLMRDLQYYREVDRSVEQARALMANNAGDPRKLQNIVVPVVMPQVESALAYLAGVFLSGYPIFGIAANPSNMAKALQMESVIADNSIYYGWVHQLIMFLRNTLKYNMGALEVTWKKKRIYSLVTDPAKNLRQGTSTEKYYEGNCIKNLDLYNLIWDKRVHPSVVHSDGEFVGYTEVMSRIQLKQLLLDLDSKMTMNARKAFESGSATMTLNGSDSWYYIPQINPLAFIGTQTYPSTNWMAWALTDASSSNKNEIKYNNVYEVTTLYGRIIPQDFLLTVPQRNQPQIWKFILVNRQVVIYTERLTNAHNNLPIFIGQAINDGLGYQTKSFLDNAVPFQAMSTALWNSALAAQRKGVYDRMFYDPARVRKADIDVVSEVARIPVKASAYGKNIQEAIHIAPFNYDGAQGNLQMAQTISTMADEANGQNKVQRGQFQKGNKTKVEFQDTMSSANSRQQLQALGLEHQFFVPLKEVIKINILQYQPATTYYNTKAKAAVKIDPNELRDENLIFKVSDGVLPTDKLLSTDLLQVFMQTIQTSPLMQSEFDIVGAFVYWCQTQGASWLDEFKRTPEQAKQIMDTLAAHAANSKPPAARPQNAQAPAGAQ